MAIPPFSFERDMLPTRQTPKIMYDHRNFIEETYLDGLSKGPLQRPLIGLLLFCFSDGVSLPFPQGFPSDHRLLAFLEAPQAAVASTHPPPAHQIYRHSPEAMMVDYRA